MSEEQTETLHAHLGHLFSRSLRIGVPVEMLHLIREKIAAGSYQSFYKEEILQEMGQLQAIVRELNSEMLRIHELLKQAG